MGNLVSLKNNVMAAVDVETTGRVSGWHEIIQIAVQPLNENLEPSVRPFYMRIAPEYPERADKEATLVHGIDIYELQKNAISQSRAADMFDEWFQSLHLPFMKSLIPLAHNWVFEAGFLKAWLGLECFGQFFHPHPRDSMIYGCSINDKACMLGDDPPFPTLSLTAMCKRLGIASTNSHDALGDALDAAKLYKALLTTPLI